MTFSLLFHHLPSSVAPAVVLHSVLLKSHVLSHRKHVALFVCVPDGQLGFGCHVCPLNSLFFCVSNSCVLPSVPFSVSGCSFTTRYWGRILDPVKLKAHLLKAGFSGVTAWCRRSGQSSASIRFTSMKPVCEHNPGTWWERERERGLTSTLLLYKTYITLYYWQKILKIKK